MKRVFCLNKETTAARYENSPDQARGQTFRGLALPRRKRHSNRSLYKIQKSLTELQSFQLGISRFEQHCGNLVVIAPRRFSRLAKSPNTGAQTIPLRDDRL